MSLRDEFVEGSQNILANEGHEYRGEEMSLDFHHQRVGRRLEMALHGEYTGHLGGYQRRHEGGL